MHLSMRLQSVLQSRFLLFAVPPLFWSEIVSSAFPSPPPKKKTHTHTVDMCMSARCDQRKSVWIFY
jgi:hypothetical protein